MRTSLVFCAICLLLAAPALAQEKATDSVSWGALKSTFGGDTILAGNEKIMIPSPWPIAFDLDSSIDETSAKLAMLAVGILVLENCTDIFVAGSDAVGGSVETAVVGCTRPNGKKGIWLVDMAGQWTAAELEITSLDINSLSITNIGSGETADLQAFDTMAEEVDAQDHLEASIEAYDIGEVGVDGFWQKVKDKWNDLNPCEQMMTVVGIVGCAGVGFPAAIPCGGVFVAVTLGTC